MSVTLASRLLEAKEYLKQYVLASYQSSLRDKGIKDLFGSSVSKDDLTNPISSQAAPISIVVNRCFDLLLQIHQAASNDHQDYTRELGSQDQMLVGYLCQLIMNPVIRPFLSPGFGSRISLDSAFNNLTDTQVCNETELCEILGRLVLLLPEQTPVSFVLKRTSNLALLFAGVIELTYGPMKKEYGRPDLLVKLLSFTAPVNVLQTMQLLNTRDCPSWSRKAVQGIQTNVLLGSAGVRHVMAFVLQSNSTGQVPLERFDFLARLIASVPASMSTTDYIRVLVPQLLSIMEEQTANGELRRRATARVLQKLFEVHSESFLIVEAVWGPFLEGEPGNNPSALNAPLQCLSNLSAFPFLRPLIFPNRIPLMVVMAYNCHARNDNSSRDVFERLIYRCFEEDAASKELMASFEALLSVDTTADSAKSRPENMIEGQRKLRVSYFCRLLDQNEQNASLILAFLLDLLQDYLRLSRESLVSIQAQLLMVLPDRYASILYSIKFLSLFLGKLSNSFDSVCADLTRARATDKLVVLCSLLNSLITSRPILDTEQLQTCDTISTYLDLIVSHVRASDLRDTASHLRQQLQLIILQARAQTIASEPVVADPVDTLEIGRKTYAAALQDLGDEMIPNRAHGLFLIGEMAGREAHKDIIELTKLSPIILGLLAEDEPFVHHNAIKAMKKLLLAYGEDYRVLLGDACQSALSTASTKDRIRTLLAEEQHNGC